MMRYNTPWQGHKKTPHPWQQEALQLAIADLMDDSDKRSVVRACTGSGKSLVQVEICNVLYPSLAKNERIILSVPKQRLVDQMFEDLNTRIPGKVRKWYQYERKTDRPIIVACHNSMMEGGVRCMTCNPPSAKEIARRARKKIPYIPLEGTALQKAVPILRCTHFDSFVYDPTPNSLAVRMVQQGLTVRFWVADEIHQTECSRILSWALLAQPIRRVGFTATPYRTVESQHITLFEEQIYHYGITEAVEDGIIVPPRFVDYEGSEADINMQTLEMIWDAEGPGIVNAWDINDAEDYAGFLTTHGFPAKAIHSELSKGEQRLRERDLMRGRLRALVHVNLLSEGRNFPWLRWIALRRSTLRYDEDGNVAYATMSRTRFAQEVGRVLRTYKDKAEAVIYDPNGLRSRLNLSYEEVLGLPPGFEVLAIRERTEEELPRPEDVPADCVPLAGILSMKNPVVRWLTKTAHWLKAEGHAPWTPRQGTGRREPLIEQYQRLASMGEPVAEMMLPAVTAEGIRKGVKTALRRKLSRTQMEDLLFIMEAVVRLKRWPE
jgi:superfamily II DNA or RNA helicase